MTHDIIARIAAGALSLVLLVPLWTGFLVWRSGVPWVAALGGTMDACFAVWLAGIGIFCFAVLVFG